MENGGAGEHRPWMFDDETNTIFRQFAHLHSDLVPYLMEEGGLAFSESNGLMDFTDKETYTYLLGRDLFVAPVLDASGTVQATFPEGEWVYAFDSSQVFEGGSALDLTVPLAEFPLFYRAGSEVGDTVVGSLSR